MYDYLIVGAGLYGAVFASQAIKKGKSVLVIDRRPNVAGNVYTKEIEGIHVHKYGVIHYPLTCTHLIKCGVLQLLRRLYR